LSDVEQSEIAIERIRQFRELEPQLQNSQNIVVDGNPASQLPVFALEVLYARNWGNGPIKLNFANPESPTMAQNKAKITIQVTLDYRGKSEKLDITTEWTQDGDAIKVNSEYNGKFVLSDTFTANEGKQKVEMANDSLQRSVTESVMKALDNIDAELR